MNVADRIIGRRLGNAEIADRLERVADLLEAQDANPYRFRAYRHGARSVREYPGSIADLAVRGSEELEALPGIGPTIASSIRELVDTGQLRYLRRLEGDAPAETLLRTVPGIGARTAHRIHTELGLETLEELEVAAHDGRLTRLRGFGPRRVRAIQEIVGAMLDRRGKRGAESVERRSSPPDVTTLLSVDEEYRVGADVGALPVITPRRFNPNREAWLPVLHTERGAWRFTVLFSNSARAHERHATRDWVVVYFEREGEEGQCTVVTETRGSLAGRRVVRGRERECSTYYSSASAA
jgi:hypothetical protein